MDKVDVIDELGQNFIDFAYEANVNRAFFDARDGLKLGQRCCLWDMYINKCTSDKPHVKSAKIAGSVCGRWHPHGDVAIYETFVRMTQNWINNNPEVEGHGGFGNQIIGPEPASSRYTEARLAPIVEEGMLVGIDKDVVDMVLNYTEDEYMPSVLPSVFPRLFVNGGSGIGVSLANLHLPHNLTETANLIINYINSSDIDYTYTPDFPSGGTLVDISEVEAINRTGKGKVVLDAKYSVKKNEIMFTELCYQTYIEPIIEQIKAKIDSGAIIGVKSVNNKSDKTRLCLSIEVQKNIDPESVVEQLFASTDLWQTYNANQIAIVGKTPKLLSLKEMVDIYIAHNVECIRREFEFDYNKTKDRLEIVNGLIKCMENIDLVVSIIRNSKNSESASVKLQEELSLTQCQAKAILDMRLAKLNALDADALSKEKDKLEKYLKKCDKIRSSEKEQKKILITRLSTLTEKYGSPRRTQVYEKDLSAKKITKKSCYLVIQLTDDGYLQRVKNPSSKNYVDAGSEDMLYLFSNKGKMFRIVASDVSDSAKGSAAGALVNMDSDERIMTIMNDKCEKIYVRSSDRYAKQVLFKELAGKVRNLKGTPYIKLNTGSFVETIRQSVDKDTADVMGKNTKGKRDDR